MAVGSVDLRVPWVSQHFSAENLFPLHGESEDFWAERCCGLACLSATLGYFSLNSPSLSAMLDKALQMQAWTERGWSHSGLVRVAQLYGLDGGIGAVDGIAKLDELVHFGVVPIVSCTLGFPMDGRKGGHLVIYNGRHSQNPSSISYMDPSRWGREREPIDEERFAASFTGRVITLWSKSRVVASPLEGVIQGLLNGYVHLNAEE